MKRIVYILLSGLFLFTTTGFTITKHYCHGNLIDIAINSTPESCCGDDGDGCCSDTKSVHQFKSIFVIPANEPVEELQIAFLDISYVEIENQEVNLLETIVDYQANSPPHQLKEILYISENSSLSPPLF